MTITLSIWVLPIAATVVVWLLAIYYRADSYSRDIYGVGAAFDAVFRVGFGLFMTLGIWLTFFGLMWWWA